MDSITRILHLEDSPRDAAIVADLLDFEGGHYDLIRAANRAELRTVVAAAWRG